MYLEWASLKEIRPLFLGQDAEPGQANSARSCSPSFFPFLSLLTASAVASFEAFGKVLQEKKKGFRGIGARKRLQLSGALVDRQLELSGSSQIQHSRFTESVDLA
ncbi:hypothetical protein M9H77_12682 [Catharanthus roseus]|uniref:Uncharacterized protein n=1 Tax=Catharanthus roseus TaxID=4058 RepID=A0ACC0BI84_CATRO|nr:hypothetical protein M9H77_12682 [Catharanthus roseus]